MMENVEPIALAAQIAMGLVLAACAGFRAFVPPLVLGIAARAGLVSLPGEFAWLGGTPALVALSAAVIFEVLGDKFPLVDHLLDVAGTVIRPAAGALVATVPLLSAVQMFDDAGEGGALRWSAAVAGTLVGGGAGGAVHLVKSQVRLAATPLTAGLANPVISLLEDGISLVGSVLAIIPMLALVLVVAAAAGFGVWLSRRRAQVGVS